MDTSRPYRKYGDADGYDTYMGGWSAALCQPFVDFVGVSDRARIIDVGCGTGNLLASLATAYPGSVLTGVDPSMVLLEKARQRSELRGATLIEGFAEHLPLDDNAADFTLSMLVLQEFPDRLGALAQMRRVTRRGGVVAACQWDFSGMPVIASLMAAIKTVDPASIDQIAANSPRVFEDEDELRDYWRRAGFEDVRTGRVAVDRSFETFDRVWRPLLAGSTPSTLALAALPITRQEAARSLMKEYFSVGSED